MSLKTRHILLNFLFLVGLFFFPSLSFAASPELSLTTPLGPIIIDFNESLTLAGTITDPDINQPLVVWANVAGITKSQDQTMGPLVNEPWSLTWSYRELSNSTQPINSITIYARDAAGEEAQLSFNFPVTINFTPSYVHPQSNFEIAAPLQSDPFLTFTGIAVSRYQSLVPNSNLVTDYVEPVVINDQNEWTLTTDQIDLISGNFILPYSNPASFLYLFSRFNSPEIEGIANNLTPDNSIYRLKVEYLYRTPNNLDWRVTGSSFFYTFDDVAPEINLIPLPAENQWFNTDFDIFFSATDSGTGVKATRYFFGDSTLSPDHLLDENVFGADCMSGTATAAAILSDPMLVNWPFNQESIETLYLCSVDYANNTTVLKTNPYQLDKTPPVINFIPSDPNFIHTQPQTGQVLVIDDQSPSLINSGINYLRYSWSGGELNTACTNGGSQVNSYNLPLNFNIPQGENTLFICAVDWAGNVTSRAQQYRALYDANLPTVYHSTNGILGGSGDFVAFPDIQVSALATVSGVAAVRFQWDTPLSLEQNVGANWFSGDFVRFTLPGNGQHLLYYQALDNFGLTSPVVGPYVFNIGTLEPTLINTLIDQGRIGQNGWYLSPPTQRVTVINNDQDAQVAGLYRARSNLDLNNAANFIDLLAAGVNYHDWIPPEGVTDDYYQGQDTLGRQTVVGQNTFRVDSASPSATLSYQDGYTNQTTTTLSMATSDPTPGSGLSSCQIQFRRSPLTFGLRGDWSEWQLSINNISCADTELVIGDLISGQAYQFRYVVSDVAGNQTITVPTAVLGVDITLPSASATLADSQQWFNYPREPVLTATDSASGIALSRYVVDESFSDTLCTDLSGGTEFSNQDSLLIGTEGNHLLQLCARDQAGNFSTFSGNYKIDLSAPSLTLSGDSNNWHNTNRLAVLTAADTYSGLSHINYNLNTNNLGADCSSGISVNSNDEIDIILEGDQELFACAIDHAQNIATLSGHFRLDFTSPQNYISADHAPDSPDGWYTASSPLLTLASLDPLRGTPTPVASGIKEYRYHWIEPSSNCLASGDGSVNWLQLSGAEAEIDGQIILRNNVTVPDHGEQKICLQTRDWAGNFTSQSQIIRVAGDAPTLSADYIIPPSLTDGTLSSSGWALFTPTWKVTVLSQDNSAVTQLNFGTLSNDLSQRATVNGQNTVDHFGFGENGAGYTLASVLTEGTTTYYYQGQVASSRVSAIDSQTFNIDLYPPVTTFQARTGTPAPIIDLDTTQADTGSGLDICSLAYRWAPYDPTQENFVIDFIGQSPNGWQTLNYSCQKNNYRLDPRIVGIPNASAIQFRYVVTDLAERETVLPDLIPDLVNVNSGQPDDPNMILYDYNNPPTITIDHVQSGNQVGPNLKFDLNAGLVVSGQVRDQDTGQSLHLKACIYSPLLGADICHENSNLVATGNLQDYSFSFLGTELGEMTDRALTVTVTVTDQLEANASANSDLVLTIYPVPPVPPPRPIVETAAYASSDYSLPSSASVAVTAAMSVGWTSTQAVAGGQVQVLFPAADGSEQNDGIADPAAFDFGANPIVNCPTDVDGYTFSGQGSSVDLGAIEIDGQNYNAVNCNYSGSGKIGMSFSENPIVVQNLINPTTEKSLPVIIRVLSQSGNVVEQYQVLPSLYLGKVKVTAKIQGEITMTVTGLPAQDAACGEETTQASTPNLIDFGSPLLNDFAVGAQQLEITSSIPSGYQISILQSDQMRRFGSSSEACSSIDGDLAGSSNPDCINDIRHQGASPTQEVVFDNPVTQKGLGYTVKIITSQSQTAGQNFATGLYRQLADQSAGESPVPILYGTARTDYDRFNVCYKLSLDAGLNAGSFENAILYTLTAAF